MAINTEEELKINLLEKEKPLNDNVLLAAYSEIALKSPPVRLRLERLLIKHIRIILEREGSPGAKVGKIQGRLIIEGIDPVKISETVSKVFGIASAMPAIRIDSRLNTIIEEVTDLAAKIFRPNQTFAVRARRTRDQPYTSKEIEVKAGAEILKCLSGTGIRVNLDNPDTTIHVEVREDAAYLYHRVFHGSGGLPFGSQGKLICLFSGGIDSPVATWLMMKRGAYVIPLFLDQTPFVGESYRQKVEKVARKIRHYVPLDSYFLHVVPMGKIMEEIAEKIPSRFTCVVCKRMMYRIACKLGERKKASGIVTGENLGQVASQTLSNLRTLDEVSSLPVYRPLIGFEKNEITDLARKISTYVLSTVKVNGCNAVPSKPATKTRIEDVKALEEELNVEKLVQEAFVDIKAISL